MSELYVEKYLKDEKSKWLVFIHGIGGSSAMWRKQVRFFKAKYNLLLIDLPGHGKSVEGIANKGYKCFEDIADVIVDTIRKEGIEKATFISVSMGTMVVGGILKKYPEMVEGAVLSDVILNVNIFYRFLLRTVNKIKFVFTQKFILSVGSKILIPLKQHKLVRFFYIKSGMSIRRKEFMAWLNLMFTNLKVLNTFEKCKDNILVVMGNQDYTLIKGVKRYFNHLKNNQLKILDNCGHICCMLKWKEFNDICLNYVESLA